MNSLNFSQTTEKLAEALKRWSDTTRPIAKGEPVPLQGLDRSNHVLGLNDLFYVDGEDYARPLPNLPLRLLNQELLDTGTLRNSLFPQVMLSHSQIIELALNVHWRGRIHVLIYLSRTGDAPLLLAEQVLASPGPATEAISIGNIENLPRNARLFWVARALDDGCEVMSATWQTRAPSATEGRMVVLMRTYGRTRDILQLLGQLHDQRSRGDYDHFLANCFFVILDSSPGLTAETYAELDSYDQLNAFVFNGPNLGGGGNMSQEILLLDEALKACGVTVNELLLLDDDLSVSLESLARNWGATLFRKDHAFHTLPVFMKSEPRKMWEDGGFWGRFTPDSPRGQRSAIAPRLLRHNRVFRRFDHLDDMARLHHAEYSTFIFLSLPLTRMKELGFPAAFFLRGDDIEYNLRHGAAGGVTVSNPNLCAWHEPAHSYAQEYMSIVHGTIINMAYGQDKPDDLVAFFHARAKAHLSLSDVAGLSIYADVLCDLTAMSWLMETDFASNYLAMLARYRKLDAAYATLPDELVSSIQQASRTAGKVTVEAPFLYMQPHGEGLLDRVVLWNMHTERRVIYDPSDSARLGELAGVAARLYAALSDFIARFDELRRHYNARLKATSQAAFWQEEMAAAPGFEVLHG